MLDTYYVYRYSVLHKHRGVIMAEKNHMIALRLNDEQMSAVRVFSKTHGVSISEVIRAAIEIMTGAKQ